MISKELLTIIMGYKIERFRILSDIVYVYFINVKQEYFINIYELSYKCREWARNNNYEVSARRPIVQDDEGKAVINYWYKAYIHKFELGAYHGPEQILEFDVNCSSEPEAIFRACEWILNKIKD